MSAFQTPNLTALLGSRICHDLVNPLGAIGNGLELLGLTGNAQGEEMKLVTESVENATAKLKFLRFAFGDATPDQTVNRNEILSTLDAVARGGRLSYGWNVSGDALRQDLRTALLAVMCVETALPHGGDIEISNAQNTWSIYAKHDRLSLDPDLWAPLAKGISPPKLTASQVHFGLLPTMNNRPLSLSHGPDWVQISF